MEYKRFGQKILLRLNPGEEVAECIREVCRTEKVALGEVSGLGAASEAELGVFDTTEKKYYGKSFKGNYEIASLTGSITQQGENPYLHLHMVIGNPLVGECHGGPIWNGKSHCGASDWSEETCYLPAPGHACTVYQSPSFLS